MFERYTESARRALFFARAEVASLGGATIEADHLLLGVLRANVGVTEFLFARAALTYEQVRAEAEARAKSLSRAPSSVEIPFSHDARRALECAAEEADRLLHSYIGTEHLLLGLLREPVYAVAPVLAAHGLQLDAARNEIVRLLNEGEAAGTTATAHGDIIERLKRLVQELAALVDKTPEALALILEIQLKLEELGKK